MDRAAAARAQGRDVRAMETGNERGAGPSGRVRRIIVDCTFITPHPAQTGIPRVVEHYVRHGAEVAKRLGVDLVAAQCVDGIYHLRGAVPAEAPASRRDRPSFAFKVVLELVRYLSRILRHGAELVGALLPARPIRRAMGAIAGWSAGLVSALRRKDSDRRREPGTRFFLGAGDILFCPGYWHDMDMEVYERARAQGAEIVFLVHDILPVTMPTHYQYPWRQDFARRLSRSFGTVSHYYGISRQTLSEVRAFGAWQGHEVRGSVAYNGFDPPAPGGGAVLPAVADVLTQKPWLMVGTLEPKKGHGDAIAAFEHLWRRGYQRPLVLAGRHGWMSEPIVDAIRASPWLGTRLFWFEGLQDASISALYAGAHALLFGSLAEGFGLPLLEAVAHGTPVLVRDAPVAREILGPVDCYFADMAQLVARIEALEAPDQHAALCQRLAGLTWFGWRDVVEAVILDLLRRPEDRKQDGALLAAVTRLPVWPGAARPVSRTIEPPGSAAERRRTFAVVQTHANDPASIKAQS
ncbi:glycosyltransferase family 4 protein [Aquabacter spiritensis]|uniref:Glycosyltransferase involved in cell wall biosynthesis n=1 Tax=Aquabacter spiritensis TaxID=933073 RepID=A0A4R3LYY2_9HYPH|nr:glycosyltransferase family 1 protein [Aquabacter spiritensis]TCT05941.1 glycosyltransferase involved in cell wall biosynthesis [Aquabacter spiritensis]